MRVSGTIPQRSPSGAMVRATRDKLQPFAHGVYVNQTSETGGEVVMAVYGASYTRLVEIKKTYDPNKVLRLNQNIKPS